MVLKNCWHWPDDTGSAPAGRPLHEVQEGGQPPPWIAAQVAQPMLNVPLVAET
jgi:hypothetical protein